MNLTLRLIWKKLEEKYLILEFLELMKKNIKQKLKKINTQILNL